MQNKKQIILSIIAIVTLAILVIGASFAYFAAQGNTSAQTSATVKTYTVDVFSFETGAPISCKSYSYCQQQNKHSNRPL